MNIGIDIDDTISETYETLLPYSQKFTIEDLKRKPQLDYDMECGTHFYVEAMNHWNEEERQKFWKKYYGEMLKIINIKKFAAETINQWKKEGHKIFIVTARWDLEGQDTKQITKDWLAKNNVNYDELIINAEDKLSIVKDKNIDLFIDDSFNNCKTIAENSNIKVWLMHSRVNAKMTAEGVRRVFSWPEIKYLFENEQY